MKKLIFSIVLSFVFLLLLVSCSSNCHHWNTKSETIAPTCDAEGYTLHTCPDCGYSYKTEFREPLGHKLEPVVTPPTCTEVGYTTFTCSVCAYTYASDYALPTGHTFDMETIEPTCTEAGYEEYTCTVCSYSYRKEYTAAPGHTFDTTLHEPTCTEPGYTDYVCSVCAFSYTSDFVDAKGHDYVTERHAPTFTEAGKLSHKCSVCDHSFESDPIHYAELLLSSSPADYETRARGVDLSHHQGAVDFEKLREGGIDFVILRVGFSASGKDSKFDEYYAGATAAGLDVGCYLYTESKTVENIKSDVKKLLGYLGGKQLTYPVYLDMETEPQKVLSAGTLKAMLRAFAVGMLDAGYFPGLYTNPDWLNTAFAGLEPELLMDIWLARYNQADYQKNPDYHLGQYGIWQYCDSGNAVGFEAIPGVTGIVDLDICYKDYPTIIKKYGWNGTD